MPTMDVFLQDIAVVIPPSGGATEALKALEVDRTKTFGGTAWAISSSDDAAEEEESLDSDDDDDDETADDDDEDDSCDEQENQIVQRLVQAAFSGNKRNASIANFILQQPIPKKTRFAEFLVAENNNTIRSQVARSLSISQSAPHLPLLSVTKDPQPSSTGPAPDSFLTQLMEREGYNRVLWKASNLLDDNASFFVPSCSDAYDMELVHAVRTQNMTHLRALLVRHNGGRTTTTLQCGNKFGESIVHTACRRGAVHALRFLLEQARLSVKVCCDSGRTPLHDACWTASPNFEVVTLLLDQCPDLLHITDKRGFAPLSYVPRKQYPEWCEFLDARGVEGLIPRELRSH